MAGVNAAAQGEAPYRKAPEKKYRCQYCHRAFSRSEHRSRHERSHTKERPFKCDKCKSTFVRRDLLLRHDRTVHARDGGVPLPSDGRRGSGPRSRASRRAQVDEPDENDRTDDAPAQQDDQNVADDSTQLIEEKSAEFLDVHDAALLVVDLHRLPSGRQAADTSADVASPGTTSPSYEESSVADYSYTYTAPPPSDTLTTPSDPNAVASVSGWNDWVVDARVKAAVLNQSGSYQGSQSYTRDSALSALASTPAQVPEPNYPNVEALTITPSTTPAFTPSTVKPADVGTELHNVGAHQLIPGIAEALALASPALSLKTLQSGVVPEVKSSTGDGPSAPQLQSEAQREIVLESVRASDLHNEIPQGIRLPPLSHLNRYLSTYFDMFHHHLPFLHPVSFNPVQTAPSLLLSVLSIGALYSFEQAAAYQLHIGSKILVSQYVVNEENYNSRKIPIWVMQSSLLNMIFAAWSGDAKGLEWVCSIRGLLVNMVAGHRYEMDLRLESRGSELPSRADWLEEEGCRRTFFAVYIFFGLLTLTYNYPPAIDISEFECLGLPSSETMWNLQVTDPDAWSSFVQASPPLVTFRDAHEKLFSGTDVAYSAFATRVMINALFLEVWYHKRSPEVMRQDVVAHFKLRTALDTWKRSLRICEPESATVPLKVPFDGHPLIFNATALYRIARARLEVDLKAVQHALRHHEPYRVASRMADARDSIPRSPQMLDVIQDCFECLETAVNSGPRWIARVTPTNWSIEHPLCGMELMVILTLWLFRLEHDEENGTEEEMRMYKKVHSLLPNVQHDLGSEIAHLWGEMLSEVVVWG